MKKYLVEISNKKSCFFFEFFAKDETTAVITLNTFIDLKRKNTIVIEEESERPILIKMEKWI